MVDVLWKLLAQLGRISSSVFPVVTVGGCEAFQVRYGFNVPYNDVRHVKRLGSAVRYPAVPIHPTGDAT